MPKTTLHRKDYRAAKAPAPRSVSFLPSRNDGPVVFSEAIAHQQTSTEEMQRLWQMRWCFFWACIALCAIWMIATIATSIVVFCITKNFSSFFISAGITLPTEIMRRFANYLLPMEEKRFLLAKKKIERNYFKKAVSK